jgi:hypothetical protein
MNYIKLPVGYAETDKLNDINECMNHINELFWGFELYPTPKQRAKAIKETIKVETTRWKEKNAWAYGRYIGRLAYLINKSYLDAI